MDSFFDQTGGTTLWEALSHLYANNIYHWGFSLYIVVNLLIITIYSWFWMVGKLKNMCATLIRLQFDLLKAVLKPLSVAILGILIYMYFQAS